MHNDDKHSNDDIEVAALRKPSTEDTPQNLIDFHDLHCWFTKLSTRANEIAASSRE